MALAAMEDRGVLPAAVRAYLCTCPLCGSIAMVLNLRVEGRGHISGILLI